MSDPDDVGRDEGEQAQHDQFIEAQRAEFDIDEGKLAEPDILHGEPIIDFEDPVLPALAFQHDMRERFLTALREAVVVLREIETIDASDPEAVGDAQEKIELARSIIDTALDPEDIRRWNIEGRPLPSIDAAVAARGAQIDQAVGTIYENIGLARFNIWMYDPQHDEWSVVEGPLNTTEARESLRLREDDAVVGVEFAMMPVGEEPRPETI